MNQMVCLGNSQIAPPVTDIDHRSDRYVFKHHLKKMLNDD
jgi:hypothetical protein